MKFTRLHIMMILGITVAVWILIGIFMGKLVIFEHFPLAPLDDGN